MSVSKKRVLKIKRNQTGSTIQPRKASKKTLKSLMVSSIKIVDLITDTVLSLERGNDELESRDDCDHAVLDKFKALTLNKVEEAKAFLVSQDTIAVDLETVMAKGTVPWKDMELEVVTGLMAMQNEIDMMSGIVGVILASATELSTQLSDVVPEPNKEEPTDVESEGEDL